MQPASMLRCMWPQNLEPTTASQPPDCQNCRYLHSSASSRPTRLFQQSSVYVLVALLCIVHTVVQRCVVTVVSLAGPTTNVLTQLNNGLLKYKKKINYKQSLPVTQHFTMHEACSKTNKACIYIGRWPSLVLPPPL